MLTILPATAILPATVFAPKALAASVADPYSEDPLGLISHIDLSKDLATGTDRWQVWLCDLPTGHVQLNIETIVDQLNEHVADYFIQLSDGLYIPEFSDGRQVEGATPEQCVAAVAAAADEDRKADDADDADAPNGVVVVGDSAENTGFSTPGLFCTSGIPRRVAWCHDSYPDNEREVYVGGGSVTETWASHQTPMLSAVAHEIGHALALPHSYGGIITVNDVSRNGSTEPWEYDNPTDIMSGANAALPDVGTTAVNRYASGWMDPQAVAVHDFSTDDASYKLQQVGSGGIQMLVVPSGEPGSFIAFGGRWAEGHDRGLAGFGVGVEAYSINQTTGCGTSTGTGTSSGTSSGSGRCWGTKRQARTLPGADAAAWKQAHSSQQVNFTPLAQHIYSQGEELHHESQHGKWTLTVVGLSDDDEEAWLVEVATAFNGSFRDDDGSVHEPAIDYLAEAGVTSGCDKASKKYCPDSPVSRAQMAVMLVRAMDETPTADTSSRFSDVDDGIWYLPYVERIAELGVTVGYSDGTYRPGDTVTRAQMAMFLARAFKLPAAPEGQATFSDVDGDHPAFAAIEAVSATGITSGCSAKPAHYCPNRPLNRGAMATLLHRAIRYLS